MGIQENMSDMPTKKMKRFLTIDEKRAHRSRLREAIEDGDMAEGFVNFLNTIGDAPGTCTISAQQDNGCGRGYVDLRLSKFVSKQFDQTVGALLNGNTSDIDVAKHYKQYDDGLQEVIRVGFPAYKEKSEDTNLSIGCITLFFIGLNDRCARLREQKVRAECSNLGIRIDRHDDVGSWYVDVEDERSYEYGTRLQEALSGDFKVNYLSSDSPIRIVALG